MATNNLTASPLQYLVPTYWDDLLLTQAKEKLVLYNLVEKKPLPKNGGNVIKWSRYTLPTSGALLTEGVTPTAFGLSSVNVTGTLAQYGGTTVTSDLLVMTAIDAQIESAIEQLSYQASLTVDKLIRNAALGNSGAVSTDEAKNHGTRLAAANNSFVFFTDYPGTALSGVTATSHEMTANTLASAVAYLQSLNAPTHDDGMYYGVIHPRVEEQLRTDSTAVISWGAWNNSTVQGQKKFEQGYLGDVHGVRLFRSTNMWFHTSGTGTAGMVSAHHSLLFGKDAIGIVDIDGAVKTYVVQGPDSADPLAQTTTIGWKVTTTARVLNPSFGLVIVSGA